jgi:hypothetical protein
MNTTEANNPKSQFQIGDKVRCINAIDSDDLIEGRVYEVSNVVDYRGKEHVAVKELNLEWEYKVDRFVLVTEKPKHEHPAAKYPSKYTVAELRRQGVKVRAYHERITEERYEIIDETAERVIFDAKPCQVILPRGGKTIVELTFKNGVHVQAEQKCHPSDNYCKRVGINLCFNKLAADIEANIKNEVENSRGHYTEVTSRQIQCLIDLATVYKLSEPSIYPVFLVGNVKFLGWCKPEYSHPTNGWFVSANDESGWKGYQKVENAAELAEIMLKQEKKEVSPETLALIKALLA